METHKPEPRRLLSIKQVMQQTGLGRTSIYSLLAEGRLRSVKIKRRRLVPDDAVEELINKSQTNQGGAA